MKKDDARKNIIIDIPFNIDLSPYMLPKNYIHPKLKRSFIKSQSSEWIDRRLELFMKYTCNSLIHQTNQNFCCLLRCTQETQGVIEEKLRKYPKLPENVIFTSNAQEIIDHSFNMNSYLYYVVIDSDNMYHPTFIDRLTNFKPNPLTQTILCQKGYVFDDKTYQLASIFHESPSFYATIYNRESYPELYQQRLFEKHRDAINYPHEVMEGRNYCICTHDINVDNAFYKFNQAFKRRIIEGEEKKRVLEEWHIQA